MKDSVQEIVGKTISGIVIKEGDHSIQGQVFLVFDDNSCFEFWANSLIYGTSGLRKGGAEWARAYIADTMRCVLDYHANLKSRQEASAFDRRWTQFILKKEKAYAPNTFRKASKRSLRNALGTAMIAILNLQEYGTRECEECMQNRRFVDRTLEDLQKIVELKHS